METFWNVMITDGMVICINILLILMESIHTVDWHLHIVEQEKFPCHIVCLFSVNSGSVLFSRVT